MLEFIRRFSHSIAAKALFFLIAFVFILWGMGGVIAHLGTPDYLLKVGDLKTSAQEFHLAYQRAKEAFRKRLGDLSDEQVQEMKLPEQVLSMFIHQGLMEKELSDHALRVGDLVVKAAMLSDPRFRDPSGSFNKNQLRAALASAKMPEEAFLKVLHKETEALLFSLPFIGGGFSSTQKSFFPPMYVEALTAALAEQRTVAYLLIEEKNVEAPAHPQQEELEQFHREHAECFVVPECHAFTVAEIDKKAIEKGIALHESDVARAYDAYVERSSEEPTIRSLKEMRGELEQDLRQEQVAERIAQVVREIEDALAAGEPFEKASAAHPIIHKETTRCSAKPEQQHKVLPTPYAEDAEEILQEVMSTEVGSGRFLETRHGRWVFVRVDKIEPEHGAEFSESKDKALLCWKAQRQKETMKTLAEDLLSELKNGAKLQDLAKKHHLSYQTLAPFSRADVAQKKMPTKRGITPSLLTRLQEVELGEGVMEASESTAESAGLVAVGVVLHASPGAAEKGTDPWTRHITEDLLGQALQYSRKHQSVDINEAAFKALGARALIPYDG
ncbi:MAG: SurA N-terminal domain-containing protein [Holosporales bacterium]|nr:SurA N-terminal domain-containing protein [Holosporales bacterium]